VSAEQQIEALTQIATLLAPASASATIQIPDFTQVATAWQYRASSYVARVAGYMNTAAVPALDNTAAVPAYANTVVVPPLDATAHA
jgi:hypothetical protein